MDECVPVGSVDQVVRILQLNSVIFDGILVLVVILSSTKEAFVALLGNLVVVVHVGPATTAPGDSRAGLLHVLEFTINGVDEATEGRPVLVEQSERGGHVGVGKFEAGGVILHVIGVAFVLLLAFGVVDGLLLIGLGFLGAVEGLLAYLAYARVVAGLVVLGLLSFLSLPAFFDDSIS